jgi:hypothetical protein
MKKLLLQRFNWLMPDMMCGLAIKEAANIAENTAK